MKKYILLGFAGLLILGAVYTLFRESGPKTITPINATTEKNLAKGYKVVVFAGGCFWSLESYFEKIPEGIIDVSSGYSGGTSENPTYENYEQGGHREAVQVTYDPKKITYGELTEYYFRHIDPTDSGGSFYDRGENYTSAIYYENDEEKKVAESVIATIERDKVFEKPIVTEVVPASQFWPAEDYHQDYAAKNAAHYSSYRMASGRDAFFEKTWQGKE